MTPTLAIGCTLPASGVASDPAALAGLAQTAEDLGYDSVWLPDHVVIPERISSAYPYSPDGRFPTPATQPYLEPLAGLCYLAGATRRVRLGTHVLILPYRHPLLTAKMVSTIDNLTGGRIELGIGVGWMREEFAALGLDDRVFTRRGAATDEQLRILKTVWTQDIANFDGEFYSVKRFRLGVRLGERKPKIFVAALNEPDVRAKVASMGLEIVGSNPEELDRYVRTEYARWSTLAREAQIKFE